MTARLEDVVLPATSAPDGHRAYRIEPSPRWVRAYFAGVAIADSRRVLLVTEPRRFAVYWFPVADVRMDLLTADAPDSTRRYWRLQVGERVVEQAAWDYPQPVPELAPLSGYLALHWSAMEAWYEEDDEVFVHARDPYHRVDVLHSSRHVRIEVGGQLLAESRRPRLLFETGLPTRYYLPKQDVRMDLLEPSSATSRCPYKGVAHYWSVTAGGEVLPDLAWSYPLTIAECTKIENLVSFYNEKVDITVDGELQERPRTHWS